MLRRHRMEQLISTALPSFRLIKKVSHNYQNKNRTELVT